MSMNARAARNGKSKRVQRSAAAARPTRTVNESDQNPDPSADGAERTVEIPGHEQEMARLKDERDQLEVQLQRTLADFLAGQAAQARVPG